MGAQALPKVSNGAGAGKKFKGAARRSVTLGRLRGSTDPSAGESVSPQRSEEQPVLKARTDSEITSERRRSSDVGVHRHVYSFTRKRFEDAAGSGEPRQRTLASTAGTILEGTKRVMQSLRFSQLVMSQAHERKLITTLQHGTQQLLATFDWARFGFLLRELLEELRAQPVSVPELERRIQETCNLLELQNEARREVTDAIKELRYLRMSHHNWRKLQDAHGCITRFRAAMQMAQAGTKDLANSVLRLQRHADEPDEGTPGASSSAAASSSGAPPPEPEPAAAAGGPAGRVPGGLWPALGSALVAAGFREEAFRDACTQELAPHGISAEEIAQDLEVFKRRALAESMNNAVDELTRPEAEEVDQEEFQEIALDALADDPPHEDVDEDAQPQPPELLEASSAGSSVSDGESTFGAAEDMQPQPPEPLEASSAGSSVGDAEGICGAAEEGVAAYRPQAPEASSAGSSFGDVESICGEVEEGPRQGGWPRSPKAPELGLLPPPATGSTLCSLGGGSLACGTREESPAMEEDKWPQLPKPPELRLLPLQSASSAGGPLGIGEAPCGTLEEQPGMEDPPHLCMRPGTPWALLPCASPAPPPSEPSRPSSRIAFRTAWGPDATAAPAKAPVLAPLEPLPKPSPLRPQVFQRRWSQLRVEQQRGRGRSAAWLQEARPVTAAPLTPEAAGARRQRLLLLVPNEHVTPFSARMRSRARAQYEPEACEFGYNMM